MRGKCERRRGSANADAADAKVFAGDGCSQGASFDPMAAISRRGQGGRIYNNTRARVLLRRMCVKPADLTTHSPPKTCSRPRTATRPSRALSLPHAARCIPRRPHNPFPAEDLLPPPAQRRTRPERFLTPSPPRRIPPRSADARPPTSRPIPRRRTSPFPQRRPASPSVPLRAQKNGTAQWMCDAECLGRPSLRSVIGVGEPRAVRRRCGALAWRVGLRPQPWALRSRRCGRVLRA